MIHKDYKFGTVPLLRLSDAQVEIAELQEEQLESWRPKLRPEVFNDLQEWLHQCNKVLTHSEGETFDPYAITRGTEILNYICNWRPKNGSI